MKNDMKSVVVPEGCRQGLAKEGKPYPRSSCAVCGPFSPRWRECDAMLTSAPAPSSLAGGEVEKAVGRLRERLSLLRLIYPDTILVRPEDVETILAALSPEAPRGTSTATPGGWLIKDHADGWLWTPTKIAAVAALTEGHKVYSISRGEYESAPFTDKGAAVDAHPDIELPECQACGGTGKIEEAARTEGANQHSACVRICDDCDGCGFAPDEEPAILAALSPEAPAREGVEGALRMVLIKARSELAIQYCYSAGRMGIAGCYPELAEKYGGSAIVQEIDAALALTPRHEAPASDGSD